MIIELIINKMCFDWLFNMQVPDSTEHIYVCRPTGKTFVTGLS